jgi:hypothetical protein
VQDSQQCVSADELWRSIESKQALSKRRRDHVKKCVTCSTYLEDFSRLAKAAGFTFTDFLAETPPDSAT